jgi:hypothetical protein
MAGMVKKAQLCVPTGFGQQRLSVAPNGTILRNIVHTMYYHYI